MSILVLRDSALIPRWYDANAEGMLRSSSLEILDRADVPPDVASAAYHDLTRTHRWLGNTAAIVAALARDPLPVRRVLDLGCGEGGMALEIRRKLGAEIVGVDLRLPAAPRLPIIRGDAVRDSLPPSDVAIAVCLVHHFAENELIVFIRNVGRSCRRLIVLDLVRHGLPLALFRTFVAPFIHPVAAADGKQSIRRAYTVDEMGRLVRTALEGGRATFRHTVTPFYTRQMVDISYSA